MLDVNPTSVSKTAGASEGLQQQAAMEARLLLQISAPLASPQARKRWMTHVLLLSAFPDGLLRHKGALSGVTGGAGSSINSPASAAGLHACRGPTEIKFQI